MRQAFLVCIPKAQKLRARKPKMAEAGAGCDPNSMLSIAALLKSQHAARTKPQGSQRMHYQYTAQPQHRPFARHHQVFA